MRFGGHPDGCDCVYCWRAFSRRVDAACRRIEDRRSPARTAHRTAFRYGRGLLAPPWTDSPPAPRRPTTTTRRPA